MGRSFLDTRRLLRYFVVSSSATPHPQHQAEVRRRLSGKRSPRGGTADDHAAAITSWRSTRSHPRQDPPRKSQERPCASADSVRNASDDLPDPETRVNITSASRRCPLPRPSGCAPAPPHPHELVRDVYPIRQFAAAACLHASRPAVVLLVIRTARCKERSCSSPLRVAVGRLRLRSGRLPTKAKVR